MRLARPILSMLVMAGAILVPARAIADEPAAPTAQATDQHPGPIQSISQAPDPSSVVAAYAKALSAEPDNTLAIESAYVKRMVELDVPTMAEAQAQDLVLRDPDNALAWAVLAECSARREHTAAALGQIQTAVQLDPNDPFIQRTAGQLLAWYDSAEPKPDLPDSVVQGLGAMRDKVAGTESFEQGYELVREQYAAQPTTEPAPGEGYDARIIRPSTPAPASTSAYPYDDGNVYTYGGYTTYAPYYAPAYYAPVYPRYGGWYGYWPWRWWFGSSIIIFNKDKFHHKHHGKHFDHDGKHFKHDGHRHGFDHHDGKFVRSGSFNRSGGRFDGRNRGNFNRPGGASDRMRSGGGNFVGPVQSRQSRSVFVGPVQQSQPTRGTSNFVGPVQRPAGREVRAGGSQRTQRSSNFVGPVQRPAEREVRAGGSSRPSPARVSPGRSGPSRGPAVRSGGGGAGRSSGAPARGGGGGARGGGRGGGGRGR